VARKRKQPKRGPRLTAAQRRIYTRGVRAGLKRARVARHRQAVAAGKKSGEARRKKKAKPKAAPTAVGDAVVLYEASPDEAAPLFVELPEWPVKAAEWQVEVQLLVEGKDVAHDTVPVQAVWENETVGRLIRREVRAWYDTVLSAHPDWRESPRALALRLSLVVPR
jgi:hypothetical protein